MVCEIEDQAISGMSEGGFHCENCGAELPQRFVHSKMVACTHCGSTSVLRDEVFQLAGSGGVMQEAPSLIHLGVSVRVGGMKLLPVGHARFSYGRGWWDEYWCLVGSSEQGRWLSVDEGDYAIEYPLAKSLWPDVRNLSLGQSITVNDIPFIVSEAESATCLAVRGELPEELNVGESHLYYDLASADGGLATYEVWGGGRAWTIGRWVDPWEVHAA